jgi:hypothetical protein
MKALLLITFFNGVEFVVPPGWNPREAPSMALCYVWKAAAEEYINGDPMWRVRCERVE